MLCDFKECTIMTVSHCMYVCMLYVLCMFVPANFFVTTEPILVKLIAFCLASINLGHGARIIKIGQIVFKLHQKIRHLFHYNTLYARAGKGRSFRRPKKRSGTKYERVVCLVSFLARFQTIWFALVPSRSRHRQERSENDRTESCPLNVTYYILYNLNN